MKTIILFVCWLLLPTIAIAQLLEPVDSITSENILKTFKVCVFEKCHHGKKLLLY
jgi:hypothetical protein